MADIVIPKFREWMYPVVSETRCVKVRIPDSDQHAGLLAGVMALLTKDENWQAEEGETSGDLADIWAEAYLETDWEGCDDPVSALPIGTMLPFAGTTAPTGYLMCQGQAVSRATYAALFALIGTAYGTGDGTTTFNLPDGRGTTLIGAGQAFSGGTTWSAGTLSGTERITLSVGEMPSHSHYQGRGFASGAIVTEVPLSKSSGFADPVITTGSTGGNSSHNNMQPSQVIGGFMIYTGV